MSIYRELIEDEVKFFNDSLSNISLIEFFSRPARKKIAENLCEVILKKQGELGDRGVKRKKGRPPYSGVTLLASMMGVSRKSVGRWLNGDMQSSNVNATKLLGLALKFIPEVLEEVLLEDLERHRIGVKVLLTGTGDGAKLR